MTTTRTRLALGGALAATALLAACSSTGADSARSGGADAADGPARTVTSCGTDVTVHGTPKRVIVQNAMGVAQLDALDLLDSVVARSGEMDTTLYGPENGKFLEGLDTLEAVKGEAGHATVSTEALLEARPDLILAYPSGLDVEKARESGLNVYVPESYCPDVDHPPASYDDIYRDLEDYGVLFGKEEQVGHLVATMKDRVAAVERTVAEQKEHHPDRSVAVLWITPGDSTLYAYGPASMAHLQAESIGLRNVYADGAERVFEVSAEDVLERNPDQIVLLHSEGTPKEVIDTFLQVRGAATMAAVRDDRVTTMSFAKVDPPSPLSVTGLEDLYEQVWRGKAGD